jgi:hypothetical protein
VQIITITDTITDTVTDTATTTSMTWASRPSASCRMESWTLNWSVSQFSFFQVPVWLFLFFRAGWRAGHRAGQSFPSPAFNFCASNRFDVSKKYVGISSLSNVQGKGPKMVGSVSDLSCCCSSSRVPVPFRSLCFFFPSLTAKFTACAFCQTAVCLRLGDVAIVFLSKRRLQRAALLSIRHEEISGLISVRLCSEYGIRKETDILCSAYITYSIWHQGISGHLMLNVWPCSAWGILKQACTSSPAVIQ